MQPHRSNAAARWCCRRFDSGTHAWCGRATVMVLVSSASGPRVSGCPRAPLNFNPYPVAVTPEKHLSYSLFSGVF